MKDENEFPKTLHEAVKHFADADVALNFMVSIRWPNGVKCPRCGSEKVSFTAKRRVWTCECCPNRRQFSIKVGTIMEDSPITLDKWITGMWLIVSAKNGISSYELHRALGITQKSAWFLGHRIRLALQNGTFEKLSGEIEADESYIGGKARNMNAKQRERGKGRIGTGGAGKAIVMGLLERNKDKASRVKVKHIPNAKSDRVFKKTESAMPKNNSAKDIVLAPVGVFKDAVKAVLSSSKQKSDKQLAEFQASNARKRAAKK
jgi:transposase-like protein